MTKKEKATPKFGIATLVDIKPYHTNTIARLLVSVIAEHDTTFECQPLVGDSIIVRKVDYESISEKRFNQLKAAWEQHQQLLNQKERPQHTNIYRTTSKGCQATKQPIRMYELKNL